MLARLLLLITLLTTISTLQTDVQQCTKSVHVLTDDVYAIINSAFKNEYVPDKSTLYGLLDGVHLVILKCGNKDVNLDNYKPCVDRVYPVLPEIEDLIFSIEDKDYREIVKDVVHISLNLINGISYCIDI